MPVSTAPLIRRPVLRLDPATGSLIERCYEVQVLAGPSKGAVARVEKELVVGSGRGADVRLNDATVSRRHASIAMKGGAVQVRDLGSTNGVFLGSARVTEALVEEEAVITLGQCRLRIAPIDNDLGRPEAAAGFGELIGKSPAMLRLFGVLARVAPSESSVLLRGETGTGKDVVAHSLHQRSHRSSGPLVVVDCAALAAGVAESELFGHAKSAFTGAHHDRAGALERADQGTLFLDEIGELPLELQPKLLRFLQSGEVQRVGGAERRVVDVRVIAATHRALAAPAFREDLYFRLAVLEVVLPPLRERPGDVSELARAMAARLAPGVELPAGLLAQLERHAWPGNVRELRNVVERALAMFPTASALERAMFDASREELFVRPSLELRPGANGDEAERQKLVAALERCGGNQKETARLLGVARGTLIARLERFGIRRPRKG